MIISKEGEETIVNGEGHTTFIKAEKFGTAAFSIKEGVERFRVKNFDWVMLSGNPFKDCPLLLKWYFSKNR